MCAQIGDGDMLAVRPDGSSFSPVADDDRLARRCASAEGSGDDTTIALLLPGDTGDAEGAAEWTG